MPSVPLGLDTKGRAALTKRPANPQDYVYRGALWEGGLAESQHLQRIASNNIPAGELSREALTSLRGGSDRVRKIILLSSSHRCPSQVQGSGRPAFSRMRRGWDALGNSLLSFSSPPLHHLLLPRNPSCFSGRDLISQQPTPSLDPRLGARRYGLSHR